LKNSHILFPFAAVKIDIAAVHKVRKIDYEHIE